MNHLFNVSSIADEEDDDEDFVVIMTLWSSEVMKRGASLCRKRWDSEYLMDLAQREGTFVLEYRVTPHAFNLLVEMLTPYLQKKDEMANRAMSQCGSSLISIVDL